MELNQFIHINAYSLTTPKKAKEGGHSVRTIVGEANREPGNHPHVNNPHVPVLLYGKSIELLESTCESWSASMTDAKGRKMRKDALCLVAGVVSAPVDIGEGWEAFRDASVDWLKRKYGDQLQTVLEHTDEDQPHLHFYVVAAPGARFDTIHEGRAASDAIKGTGLKASKEIAYNAAMTRFQDDFSAHVALRHGMSRFGPRAPRVSRLDAVKRKEIRKVVAADIARELPAALNKGLKQGQRKGFAVGVGEGKADFERKSIWAKMTDFVTRLTKQNSLLTSEVETLKKDSSAITKKFNGMKTRALSYFAELKILRPEVAELRSKSLEFQRQEKNLIDLSNNLVETKAQLSSAKSRIGHLEAVVDCYREAEQEALDKAEALLIVAKPKRSGISSASLDYS